MRLFPLRLALVTILTGVFPTLASAQGQVAPSAAAPAAPQTQAPKGPKTDSPVDLSRIEAETKKQGAIRLDDQQLRFYMLVMAKAPEFKLEDWVGDYDLQNGPTKGGAAMTHREFVNMVTPKELKELFGATSGSSFAMFQAAVMNAVGQSLISKAIRDLRRAGNEGEVQAIRERIDTELTALLGRSR